MPNYDKKTKKILQDSKIIDRNPQKAVVDIESAKPLKTAYQKKKARKASKKDTKEVMLSSLKNELQKIPIKHLAVMTEWIKSGNATEAYMKIYNVKNLATASVGGSFVIKKYEGIIRRALLDNAGATFQYLVNGVIEMTESTQQRYSKNQGIVFFPDNKTRIKAFELLGEILGELKKGRGGGTNPLNIGNVIIVKDKDKGVFSIGEEEIQEAEVV
jgi:hypothetical protein